MGPQWGKAHFLTLVGTSHTVDGSGIRRLHQLRLVADIPLFTVQGFFTPQVVGNGISEPSIGPCENLPYEAWPFRGSKLTAPGHYKVGPEPIVITEVMGPL